VLIKAAQHHAWRGMFLAVIYPGVIFFLGSFALSESPRWLFHRGRRADALAALRRASSEQEAELEMREMENLAVETQEKKATFAAGSLLQRKYVVPFILACVILSLNQATGINSVLAFLVIILKHAGMTASHATQGDVAVKVLNCIMTLVAIALVDKRGRKFLLKLGTGGIVISLVAGALLFIGVESKHTDVQAKVQAAVVGNAVTLPVNEATLGTSTAGRPVELTVLYSYGGGGNKVAAVVSNEEDPVLRIAPEDKAANTPLVIKRASYGPVPTQSMGWLITICLGFYIASYSVGPGVVVWLALSELMPTRIRSMGMGIALLLNQGISTLIAALFLPVVGNYGYYAMFLFWAGCTTLYFITAAFFLPETKGKTLEEIEKHFEGRKSRAAA
jgi:MFS transporter, SP family, solute carrier family 2 (myo-inositol transporter), member 13